MPVVDGCGDKASEWETCHERLEHAHVRQLLDVQYGVVGNLVEEEVLRSDVVIKIGERLPAVPAVREDLSEARDTHATFVGGQLGEFEQAMYH